MTYIVTVSEAGKRLDAAAASLSGLSRSASERLISDGRVLLNGVCAGKKTAVREGDLIDIEIPEPEEIDVAAEDIPLDIVYEDGDIIVINKPSGMVVHPAPGNYSGTLVNALLYHCRGSLSGVNGELRPGIVHRIDKDTSGLLVAAKNDAAHRGLAEQLEGHRIRREYRALVIGGFSSDSGTIDLPIGRHPVDRKKMAVITGAGKARDAVTHYSVLERFGQVTYLSLRLETGRTHQIRVHMSYTGHPLLGDRVYSQHPCAFERRHPELFDGQMLHAVKLSFLHPRTGEAMEFSCPLPDNFLRALELLKHENL